MDCNARTHCRRANALDAQIRRLTHFPIPRKHPPDSHSPAGRMLISAVSIGLMKVSMNDSIALGMNGSFAELSEADLVAVNGGIAPAIALAAGGLAWAAWRDVTQKIEDNASSFSFLLDWYYTQE